MLQTTKLGKLIKKCLCASFSPSFLDDAQDIVNNWIIFLKCFAHIYLRWKSHRDDSG